MICSDQIKRSAQPEDLVTEVLREITAKTITVELVNSLEAEVPLNYGVKNAL